MSNEPADDKINCYLYGPRLNNYITYYVRYNIIIQCCDLKFYN